MNGSPRSDTSGQRLAVLRRLAHPDPASSRTAAVTVLVTPVRALLQPIVGGLADVEPVSVAEGDTCDLDEMLARLVDIGYVRTDLVERRGEVAVRGGIIDVFPPAEEHPVRVELFGDDGRGDPFLPGGRPAQPGACPGPVGAAVPRTAADARRTGPGQAPRQRSPRARRRARQAGRRHLRRGHGGARAGARPPDGTAAQLRARRWGGARLRPRADPRPGRRPGPHQPGVPRGVLGERGGGRPGADRPRGVRVPVDHPGARRRGQPGAAVVDHRAVRCRRPRRRPVAAGHGVTMAERATRPGAAYGQDLDSSDRLGDTPRRGPGPCLPRRHQPGAGRRPGLAGRALAGRAGHRGPRPGAAPGRDAPR